MAFSNPNGSAHVGIDIRNVLKKHDSMFGDSLQPDRNRAPTFTKPVSRPTSRPTDISFESEIIREDSLRAQHGRRAAQTAAYAAAASVSTADATAPNPWNAKTSGQRRRGNAAGGDDGKVFSERAEDAGFSGRRSGGGKGFDELNIVAPVPKGYKMAPPAGRGLSRGGNAANPAAGAPSSSSAADAVDGLGLLGSSMSIGLGSSLPSHLEKFSINSSSNSSGQQQQQQQQQQPAVSGGDGGGMPSSWSAARAEAAGTDAASAARNSPSRKGGSGGADSPSGRRAAAAGGVATGMTRAKEWSPEVEDAYRLQVAGYKDEGEALSLGHPPIERWPDGGFVRKLVTKESLVGAKGHSQLYFSKKRECEDGYLNQVKMYTYG